MRCWAFRMAQRLAPPPSTRALQSCPPAAPALADYEVVGVHAWSSPGAYPAFDPPEDYGPFKLADGLFHAAALENAVSAMEIAAIEGRLAAQMAAAHVRAVRRGCTAGEAAVAGRAAAAAVTSKGDGILKASGGLREGEQAEGWLASGAAAAA